MTTSHRLRIAFIMALMLIASFAFTLQSVHAQTGGVSNTGTGGVSNPTTGGVSNPGTAANGTTLQNPLNNIPDLKTLLKVILQAVVELGSIALTIMLIWVGFLFVTAQGNPEKLSTARSALIWTVIGGLILLGAQAISDVIQATVTTL